MGKGRGGQVLPIASERGGVGVLSVCQSVYLSMLGHEQRI